MTQIPNTITNAQGQVALRHFKPSTVLIQNNPSGNEYVARTSHDVCLVYVFPEDIDRVFRIDRSCCGHRNSQSAFSYATQNDVDTWEGKYAPK
jgi:hypothetical protein